MTTDESNETANEFVRVRGIYSTALTEFLRPNWKITQPSDVIEARFSDSFSASIPSVSIRATDDRQGVELWGNEHDVLTLRDEIATLGRDCFTWSASAPLGAVFYGRVNETLSRGAVVDLGTTEGFLPYDRVDGYIDEGDEYRVQVERTEPPWSNRRPLLRTELGIPGTLLELRRSPPVDTRSAGSLTDILSVDPPNGWYPHWSDHAEEIQLSALEQALKRAIEASTVVMKAIASAESDGPRLIIAPISGASVWFGRETRFNLDSYRRKVVPTMAGHHRIKAGSAEASRAVDFVEALCGSFDETFPFAQTVETFGPAIGDTIAIHHGKPDGQLIVLGDGEVSTLETDGRIVVERIMSGSGMYDGLDVKRESGDVARSTFVEGRWWYPTTYRSADGDLRGTYVNISTPLEIFPTEVRYIDLHVDVVKTPDGAVRRVDDMELTDAVNAGDVSEDVADRARQVAASIENAL